MIEILKVWYLFSFSFGCWTCLNLAVSRRGDKQVKLLIGAFVALLLLPSLNAYVSLARQAPLGWLQMLSYQLTWGYGPLLLLLVRQVLLIPSRRAMLALHALPYVAAVLHSLLPIKGLPPLVMLALLFLQVTAYVVYSATLLYRQRQRLVLLAQQHKFTSYFWLLYLVGGLLFATLMDAVIYCGMIFQLFSPSEVTSMIACMLAIYVNCIALFALYQPEIFNHTPAEAPPAPVEIKPACRMIELSPQAAKELDEQLLQLVENHHPHLDPDISLGKLASLLGVTTHQLSELLNIHKETSFYDFLNELRFQESLKMLANQGEELTIADIAYRSGFNNRNSFYKVFKEKTGGTPSQYKKAQA